MISTPFHLTPHSPSGGSEKGLLSSQKREEAGEQVSHGKAQLKVTQR